jgi:UDP-N-acetylglucosamine diphosphorylase/glucosamine-1-phosphate N-acetyltransferase
MKLVLFDDEDIYQDLLPLTFVRPVSEIRMGITTIKEKWEFLLQLPAFFETHERLQKLYPRLERPSPVTLVNSALLPNEKLINAIKALEVGQGLVVDGRIIAGHLPVYGATWRKLLKCKNYKGEAKIVSKPWHIFQWAGACIAADLEIIRKHKTSADFPDPHAILYNKEQIFVEEGVKAKFCVINAESGPVYLGKNAEIQEGVMIKGPFAMGEGAVLNMGAKMRSDTVIGPYCKVGGEVSNAVLFGYSNKAHDGFLGNSVIAQWCNLGADTNNSNLKNNYSNVKIWNYAQNDWTDTGLTFCGLIMADHAKAGINTMFNTGTVVGVGANIFGGGFPDKHIPSFTWGATGGVNEKYALDKFFEAEQRVMSRRNQQMSPEYAALIRSLYTELT